jgi:hypothetical protein
MPHRREANFGRARALHRRAFATQPLFFPQPHARAAAVLGDELDALAKIGSPFEWIESQLNCSSHLLQPYSDDRTDEHADESACGSCVKSCKENAENRSKCSSNAAKS